MLQIRILYQPKSALIAYGTARRCTCIRDILGHVSIQTTEIYARADSKQKREALEAAYADIIPVMDKVEGSWEKDSKLKHWLKGLGK